MAWFAPLRTAPAVARSLPRSDGLLCFIYLNEICFIIMWHPIYTYLLSITPLAMARGHPLRRDKNTHLMTPDIDPFCKPPAGLAGGRMKLWVISSYKKHPRRGEKTAPGTILPNRTAMVGLLTTMSVPVTSWQLIYRTSDIFLKHPRPAR